MTGYATEVEVPVRYRDVDSLGHVNNAVYFTYLEQARIEYVRKVFGTSAVASGFVVAHVSIDYERSIELDDRVVVGLGVTDIGTSSVTMTYEIRADGDLAATAETVLVVLDEEGTPRSVPEAWRERVAAHEDRTF